MKEALRGSITSDIQFIDAVNEGIRAADAGDLIDHDVVMHELDDLLTPSPRGGE